MAVLRESDGSWYLREENQGFILGPYEKGAPCCYVDGPDETAEYELFQEDIDRLEPHIEAAMNPGAGFCRMRHQAGIQRRHRLHPGRQPHRRPCLGSEKLLAQ